RIRRSCIGVLVGLAEDGAACDLGGAERLGLAAEVAGEVVAVGGGAGLSVAVVAGLEGPVERVVDGVCLRGCGRRGAGGGDAVRVDLLADPSGGVVDGLGLDRV